jgi:DNA-binding LacI/PurR family transcriptional regulator
MINRLIIMSSSVETKSITIADVARAAGVSKATASFAYSGKGRMSAETRERVLREAERLGYQPSTHARILAGGRCNDTVGFFTLDIDLSGRTRQMQVIIGALSKLGFWVPIHGCGYEDQTRPEAQLMQINSMLGQRPRAVICNLSGLLPSSLERLRQYQDEGGILVCYGYTHEKSIGCDTVVFDDVHAYELAATHLLELGHRDIGLFVAGLRVPSGDSLLGFERALARHDLKPRREWLFSNEGILRYEPEGALLAQKFLSLKKRPTAICIGNDYCAAAFVKVLSDAGVNVPRQVSVVGYDDDAIAPYAQVPLTTINTAQEVMSQHIIELISSRLSGEYSKGARYVEVRGSLVARASTAPAST